MGQRTKAMLSERVLNIADAVKVQDETQKKISAKKNKKQQRGNKKAVTELVDLQGRVAARKAWSVFPSGNRIEWLLPDGLASGIYLARISLQGETRTDRAWVRGY